MRSAAPLALAVLLAGCTDPTPAPAPVPSTAPPSAPSPAPAPPPKVERKAAEPEPAPKRGEVTTIGIEQIFLLRQEDRVLMIDVRRPFFHRLGHIEGAIHLPLGDFVKAYPELKPQLDAAAGAGKVLVTYCQGEACPDARTAAEALAQRGHDVAVYHGGLEEWRAVGVE